MEVNKFIELFGKAANKYSIDQMDIDNDGTITEAELESLLNPKTEEDEEIKADLANSEISLADEVQKSGEIQKVSEVNDILETQKVSKPEMKTMEEYTEILNSKFDELYEKFNGDKEEIVQYIKNNLSEYMDVTGDGRVDKIDLQILENYLKTLPKASTSDPVEQEKGRNYVRGLQEFARLLKQQTNIVTSALNDTNSYDLEDVENYAKLGGKPSLLRANLDITSIAQSDNWRERLLSAGYPESELRINPYHEKAHGTLYKKITATQEFMKNNPDNIGYAGIAGEFKIVSDEYQRRSDLGETWEIRWDGTATYDWTFASNISLASKADINGDGKVDAKDLAAFSTNIDLDGDGQVSNHETIFLTKVKANLENVVYKDIASKSISNNASIDDIITYYDNVDENADTSIKISEAEKFFEQMKGNDKLYNIDKLTGIIGLSGRGLVMLLNKIGYAANRATRLGLLDGTGPITAQDISTKTAIPDDEVISIITQAIEQASPSNTYLHYINSADLSKEKLEEILNVINSSSAKVQSKLSEVKKTVEEKLEAME